MLVRSPRDFFSGLLEFGILWCSMPDARIRTWCLLVPVMGLSLISNSCKQAPEDDTSDSTPRDLEQQIKQAREDRPRVAVAKGNVEYRKRSFVAALQWYDIALSTDPAYAPAHSNRALTLLKLERLQEAEEAARRATELSPNKFSYFLNLSKVLAANDKLAEALRACERALELDPNDGEALYNRAWLLDDLNRFEEALAAADKAINIPSEPYEEAEHLRAIIRARYGETESLRRLAAAGQGGSLWRWIRQYNASLLPSGRASLPLPSRGHLWKAGRQISREQLNAATKTLSTLEERNPDHYLPYWLQAMVAAMQGNDIAKSKMKQAEARKVDSSNKVVPQKGDVQPAKKPLTLDRQRLHKSADYLFSKCKDAEPLTFNTLKMMAIGSEVRWEARVGKELHLGEDGKRLMILQRKKVTIMCTLDYDPPRRVKRLRPKEKAVVYGRITGMLRRSTGSLVVKVSVNKVRALVPRTTSAPAANSP